MGSDVFISVCIDAAEREQTIFESLDSISTQTYNNFELQIWLSEPNADLHRRIETWIEEQSNFCKSIQYFYQPRAGKLSSIAKWNLTISEANGDYVSVLEGDDIFSPTYLETANRLLKADPEVGVLVFRNQNESLPRDHKFSPRESYARLIQFEGIGPPSQTVFVRCDENCVGYKYDEAYKWAGEISLYSQIYLSGKSSYFSAKPEMVWRRPSVYRKSYKHFSDFIRTYANADRTYLISSASTLANSKIYIKGLATSIILSSSFFSISNLKIILSLAKICDGLQVVVFALSLLKQKFIQVLRG